jgi:predicted Mrr-cat superfamily restriction endonuclease
MEARMPNVWLTRGGKTGEFEDFALSAGTTGGGWNEPPDLTGVTTYEDLKTITEKSYAAWKPAAVRNWTVNHTGFPGGSFP